MIKRTALSIVLAMASLSAASGSPAQAAEGGDAITRRMKAAIAEGTLPGAIVLVRKDGKTVYEETFGFADREAGRAQKLDDLFNLGSTSKPVAMSVILTEVAAGRMGLDDPISRWFPGYGGGRLADGSASERMPIVREMMAHISGTFSLRCSERRQLALLYMFGRTLRESAEAIAAEPLVDQPGSSFCYGGPSMQVAGRVAEITSGNDFETLARTRVFDPLGMDSTFYTSSRSVADRLSVIYAPGTDGKLERSPRMRNPEGESFVLVPGGLYSTASDLARFLEAFLSGGELEGQRVLPDSLVLEARRNQIGSLKTDLGDPSIGDRNSAALGAIGGYGLGWILDEVGPDGLANVYSHGGAYGTYIWADQRARLAVVLMTQIPLAYATPVWNDVLPLIRATWGN
ncbi:MAG: beta-lactamase family protein [Alphaproteobacteria bacterium]|nr:beta-lactamase family protein [Alphaproteobacteria bacterium]